MKRIVAFLFAWLWAGLTFAQKAAPIPLPLDENTHRITYSAVVPVAGTSQADLLARAKVWAAGVTMDSSQPVVSNDQGTYMVTVTGSQQMFLKVGGITQAPRLRFTATVSVREGRYQYRFNEFSFYYTPALQQQAETLLIEFPAAGKGNKKYLAATRASFDEAVAAAQAQLRETMSKSPVPPKADW